MKLIVVWIKIVIFYDDCIVPLSSQNESQHTSLITWKWSYRTSCYKLQALKVAKINSDKCTNYKFRPQQNLLPVQIVSSQSKESQNKIIIGKTPLLNHLLFTNSSSWTLPSLLVPVLKMLSRCISLISRCIVLKVRITLGDLALSLFYVAFIGSRASISFPSAS